MQTDLNGSVAARCARTRLKEDDESSEHLECIGRMNPTAPFASQLICVPLPFHIPWTPR